MSFLESEFRATGIAENPGAAYAEVRHAVKQQFTGAAQVLVGALRRASPVGVSGDLSNSWTYDYDDAKMAATVSSGAEYAAPTELGRKAKGLPKGALDDWVRHVIRPGPVTLKSGRVVSADSRIKSIAFLIARKKAKQATPGQFFAKKAFEATLPTINATFIGPLGPLIVQRLQT